MSKFLLSLTGSASKSPFKLPEEVKKQDHLSDQDIFNIQINHLMIAIYGTKSLAAKAFSNSSLA